MTRKYYHYEHNAIVSPLSFELRQRHSTHRRNPAFAVITSSALFAERSNPEVFTFFKKTFVISMIFIFIVLPVNVYTKSKASLDFTSIKTSDLLKILAEKAGENIVVSDKVEGRMDLSLKDVTYLEALDSVLKMKGLIKYKAKGSLVILTKDEVEKNKQTVLKSKGFKLKHVASENIAKLLQSSGVLSEYGKIGVDVEGNYLLVSDISDNLGLVDDFINKIDLSVKQVLIEARVVSVDDRFLRELGLEFNSYPGNKKNEIKNIKSGSGQFNFSVTKIRNNLLDAKLTALESEGRGKVISKPKLLTADRKTAYIEAGAEIPYQEKTKEGNTSIAFKKAVLSLKVTPEIIDANRINLSLQLSQDKVGQLVINGVPTIDTRKVNAKVSIGNNKTVVLGGIYEWTKSSRISRVPVLGKIPVLGIFFSKKETRVERRELLIFVTPRIIE